MIQQEIDYSVFDHKNLDEIHEEIQEIYLRNEYPWVIGWSGGKDSTTTLQLVWQALEKLPKSKLNKKVYIISSDTLVETPVIVNYIDDNLNNMNKAAKEQELPFEAHKVTPEIKQTFWVKLIGRGYPAPSTQFRWCTDRLKIKPANKFILDCIDEYGEVVVILGMRIGESMTRDQVMRLHEIKGDRLKRHSELPRAYVYTPIEKFTVNDVWTYLLQVESPWGNNNRDLAALYKSAQGDDCPLVIDKSTPSCGNSRFGCWTCTVVEEDKSMSSIIDDGEYWMQPLLELRNKLKKTQDPEIKSKYRDYRRLDGTVRFKRDGQLSPGPYKLEFCKEILRDVLEAQVAVRRDGPDEQETLVHEEELYEIRRIWRTERGDWQDSLPRIYEEKMGENLEWPIDDNTQLGGEERDILNKVTQKASVSGELVAKLLNVEKNMQGMSRRSQIFKRIDQVLGEEWRSPQEVLEEREAERAAEFKEQQRLEEELGELVQDGEVIIDEI